MSRRTLTPIAVGIFALLLRLVAITRAYDLFVDEITYATIGRNLARGSGLTLYGQPFTLHPPAAFGLYATVIRLTGIRGSVDHVIMSLRPVSAVAGSLGCVALFFLVDRVVGRRAAIIAATILALDPFTISYDSLVMLESLAGAFSLATVALIASGAAAGPGRRRVTLLGLGGLSAGIVVTTKDTFGLVVSATILVLLATGWVIRRREALAVATLTASCYGIYLAALAATGDFSSWWNSNVDGLLRLVGAKQETGFNAPTVHVTLVSRALADLSGTATSYLVLGAGPIATLALLWYLRPWRTDWQERATARDRGILTITVWAAMASAFIVYSTLFGSIEEQEYYILLAPALAATTAAAVTIRTGPRLARLRRIHLDRRRLIAGIVVAVLAFNVTVWVRVHTASADGYRQFLAWESTHIPAGSTLSVTEGSAQFLITNAVLGDWDTRRELIAHHVQYVLVSTLLTDQGYEASVPFLHLVERHGHLLYSSRQPIGLQVYDVRALTGAR
jgi:4-amino-4-deoxy-L-arabinose transferase-like glycosyltransferase